MAQSEDRIERYKNWLVPPAIQSEQSDTTSLNGIPMNSQQYAEWRSREIKKRVAMSVGFLVFAFASAATIAARIQGAYTNEGSTHWDHVKDTVPLVLIGLPLVFAAVNCGTDCDVAGFAAGIMLAVIDLPPAIGWYAGVIAQRSMMDIATHAKMLIEKIAENAALPVGFAVGAAVAMVGIYRNYRNSQPPIPATNLSPTVQV